jgi:hypothetical protein
MTGQETPEGPIPWISATAVFSPSVWRLAFFLSCNRSDCVQFEHWYGDPFGCRRLLSDWAGAWIALKNGLLLDAADRLVWYGLYGYTMCRIWYAAICEGGFAGRHC